MYNPYDLMQVYIDGTPIDGRPFEFDSEIADRKTMCNSWGGMVKPTKLSTICPSCGGGMIIDLPALPDPPFQPVFWSCIVCNPPVESIPDPFINPIKDGRMKSTELDDLVKDDIKIDNQLVSERINLSEILDEPDQNEDLDGFLEELDSVQDDFSEVSYEQSKYVAEIVLSEASPKDVLKEALGNPPEESEKIVAPKPPKSSKVKGKLKEKVEKIFDDSDLVEE